MNNEIKDLEILSMTHTDLLNAKEEIRQKYRESVNLEIHNKIKTIIDNGFTHVQIGFCGCIKVRKNKNGIFYSKRSGIGTGKDIAQYADLRDCTKSLMGSGWDGNITFK